VGQLIGSEAKHRRIQFPSHLSREHGKILAFVGGTALLVGSKAGEFPRSQESMVMFHLQ
jgi:hypothetical protein